MKLAGSKRKLRLIKGYQLYKTIAVPQLAPSAVPELTGGRARLLVVGGRELVHLCELARRIEAVEPIFNHSPALTFESRQLSSFGGRMKEPLRPRSGGAGGGVNPRTGVTPEP